MNHLEQLVSEWLQYKGYFVRVSVPVGPRAKGGFEGELDVVGVNLGTKHLIHVECSLDSLSWEKREARFQLKFERGRKFIHGIFKGIDLPSEIDQVAVLQFATSATANIGGARLITTKDFIREILDGLQGTSPASGAVPSNLPLLRTLQLASHADGSESSFKKRLIVEG